MKELIAVVLLLALATGVYLVRDYYFNPERDAINHAQNMIRDMVRDGESTRFRNSRQVRSTSSGPLKVCGEFNTKNAFGAYVGYQQFVVSTANGAAEGPLVVHIRDTQAEAIETALNKPELTRATFKLVSSGCFD